jgi:thioredoxin-related protein
MIQKIMQQHPLTRPMVFCLVMLFLCLVAALNVFARSSETEISKVVDLSKDSVQASDERLVILIEFASDSCEYCRLLEEEFLKPMLIDRDYSEKVIIRSVSLDDHRAFRGFDGELTTANLFSSKYDIEVTPTMVFLSANGDELSDKLVGIWSIDFFGGFIDQRIDIASKKIH